MKCWIKIAALLLSVAAIQASAQSAPEGQSRAQETQARGVWTDPSTGLMWAARDNGKDVSWKGAGKYCRDLRLAGYSDWRLATRAELGAIYDRNANAPGLSGPGKESPDTWHVKGNLFLTGNEWSSERRYDDRGKPTGYGWYYDFNEGRSDNEPSGCPILCRITMPTVSQNGISSCLYSHPVATGGNTTTAPWQIDRRGKSSRFLGRDLLGNAAVVRKRSL